MKYQDFVPKLAAEFESELGNIAKVHNFELGDEFELALCEVFRKILPEKYGICRGHVTAEDGEQAGDDIIIFDRIRHPTILGRTRDHFNRKEWIPIEAVYAYIEAKHTLQIKGDGPSSLTHALEQAARVKRLIGTRRAVPLNKIGPYMELPVGGIFNVYPQRGFPHQYNPSFAGVLSRQVRKEARGPVLHDREEIEELLCSPSVPTLDCADLIIAGHSHIVVPMIENPVRPSYRYLASPFYLPGVSTLAVRSTEGLAFGIGICTMMWALDWMVLGDLAWSRTIGEGLGLPEFPGV